MIIAHKLNIIVAILLFSANIFPHVTMEWNTFCHDGRGTSTTETGLFYNNDSDWKRAFIDGKNVKAVDFQYIPILEKLFLKPFNNMQETMEETKEYIGMWVTEDGYIRHELLPNNRYDEARGNQKSAYQGAYKVSGNHIDYKDDTGFTADGEFRDGILYHAGMILYKVKE